MNYLNEYQRWLDFKGLEPSLQQVLNGMSESEKEDSFYKDIEFGTAGMRGIIGPGTNRMNVYTVTKANLGFAKYLITNVENAKEAGVVIAYDNRHMSKEFAYHSACVLASEGIKVYLFDELRPTPELSFAVRYLKACGGIVITASHNPPEYNGYKIYDGNGCQFVPDMAAEVVRYVTEVEDVFSYGLKENCESLIEVISNEVDEAYVKALHTIPMNKNIDKSELEIVFTPLHGTSAVLGKRMLEELGYNVHCVESQMIPDPDFSTVKSPNPEDKEAFNVALDYATDVNADIIIATDPDADRLGVAVKCGNEYKLLTGNQTGAILLHYLLSIKAENNKLPSEGVMYDTVVTSPFGATIAKHYGVDVVSTLTGFKFIGEQAALIEDTNKEFVFGYEESYGYVIKDFVRDKDSLQAMILVSEAAAYYKNSNKTLINVLNDLYEKYGYYREETVNIKLEGKAGAEKISSILESFRKGAIDSINDIKIISKEDYLTSIKVDKNGESTLKLPKSNVIKYKLEDGSWFVLRPSGTEPKLKVYFGVKGETLEVSNKMLETLKKDVLERIGL